MTRTFRLAVAVVLAALLLFAAAPVDAIHDWGAPITWVEAPVSEIAPAFVAHDSPVPEAPSLPSAPRRGPPTLA